MQIKIENFAAKNIINFYPPQRLMSEGLLLVRQTPSATDTLPNRILQIDGVTRCMVAPDVVSVRYDLSQYATVKALILAELDDFFAESQVVAADADGNSKEQAEAVADAFIRPTLNRDNGDIEIHTVTDNVLELSFTGHCAGCPYAQNTLQNVIMRTFLKYMPQIREVKLKGA